MTRSGRQKCVIDDVATLPRVATSGRPNKAIRQHHLEAASILNLAVALHLKRTSYLRSRQIAEPAALRYALKRRRGLTGQLVAKDVVELLGPPENKTQRALQLIVEHGFKVKDDLAPEKRTP